MKQLLQAYMFISNKLSILNNKIRCLSMFRMTHIDEYCLYLLSLLFSDVTKSW